MPKVPRVTGPEAIKAFERVGFTLDRIRGAHHILRRPNDAVRLSIPCHSGKTLGVGLLASQIKAANLTVEEFIPLL